MELKDKFILDACCGPRMFWGDKRHKNCLYVDIRREEKGFHKFRRNRMVIPDMIADFRKLPFPDKRFKLIVWDPPHFITNSKLDMTISYGRLKPETWQSYLKRGFNELWRVLDDYGTMIFKWC